MVYLDSLMGIILSLTFLGVAVFVCALPRFQKGVIDTICFEDDENSHDGETTTTHDEDTTAEQQQEQWPQDPPESPLSFDSRRANNEHNTIENDHLQDQLQSLKEQFRILQVEKNLIKEENATLQDKVSAKDRQIGALEAKLEQGATTKKQASLLPFVPNHCEMNMVALWMMNKNIGMDLAPFLMATTTNNSDFLDENPHDGLMDLDEVNSSSGYESGDSEADCHPVREFARLYHEYSNADEDSRRFFYDKMTRHRKNNPALDEVAPFYFHAAYDNTLQIQDALSNSPR